MSSFCTLFCGLATFHVSVCPLCIVPWKTFVLETAGDQVMSEDIFMKDDLAAQVGGVGDAL